MTAYKIANAGFRTKAFKVLGGTEDVRPGQTRTIDIQGEVTDEFIAKMKVDRVEMILVGKAAPKPASNDEPLTAAQVLAMAGDGTPFLSFKAEAKKLLGDAAPSKKGEIIAALEAL